MDSGNKKIRNYQEPKGRCCTVFMLSNPLSLVQKLGMYRNFLTLIVTLLTLICCVDKSTSQLQPLRTGAQNSSAYLPQLKGKRVGVVANHTSVIGNTHLVDSLLLLQTNVVAIFSPEHGFRGNKDAGAHIENGKDIRTGLPIFSLHGNTKKPSKESLDGIDVLVFDIQDVGVRFYTYISTLHYVMEAAAENNIKVIVLDRPNPNGDYIAGPVLDTEYKSFVGMHPIPIVYGMTMGELAQMINQEKWLKDEIICDLTVVTCSNYTHNTRYELPVKPSPNLPNYRSVRLYPSLCLFEPTQVSIGRGTHFPFQVAGFPENDTSLFKFTPISIPGMSVYPKHEGVPCYGIDLRELDSIPPFTILFLVEYFKKYPNNDAFFTSESFFNLLAGNDVLIQQLKSGLSAKEIEASWQLDLLNFKAQRKKYLLYPDFE